MGKSSSNCFENELSKNFLKAHYCWLKENRKIDVYFNPLMVIGAIWHPSDCRSLKKL